MNLSFSFDSYQSFALWPVPSAPPGILGKAHFVSEPGRTSCGREILHTHAVIRTRRTVPVDRMCKRCAYNLLKPYWGPGSI